jgi:hypothetical protein
MPTAWRGYAASGHSTVGAETTCPRCTTDDYALLTLKAVQICSHRQGARGLKATAVACFSGVQYCTDSPLACVLALMLRRTIAETVDRAAGEKGG